MSKYCIFLTFNSEDSKVSCLPPLPTGSFPGLNKEDTACSWGHWHVTKNYGKVNQDSYLEGQIVILFLLRRTQCIPPFTKYLAHRPVILVWIFLMNQRAMSLTKYHKCVHWTANIFFIFPLNKKKYSEIYSPLHLNVKISAWGNKSVEDRHKTCPDFKICSNFDAYSKQFQFC